MSEFEYRNATVPDFPNIVNVEVYRGECPCRCVHCPIGITPPDQRKHTFGAGAIALPLIEKIATEIAAQHTSILRIHSTGEPLLWRDLPQALKLLKSTRVKSWIFTSAVTTDKSLLAGICETINVVEVSVNSTTREDYTATKGVDAFTLVTENIRYMRQIAQRGQTARLIVSRVESAHTDVDQEFIRYWLASGFVDDAFVRSRHTYNSLLPEVEPLQVRNDQSVPCLVHWARFNIGLDGQAIVCFNELFKKQVAPALILGDVKSQSIAEIWKGSKLTALRAAALAGNYSDRMWAGVIPCRECVHCQPLWGVAGRNTSEHQLKQVRDDND